MHTCAYMDIFKLLSDDTKLKIIKSLEYSKCKCICEIQKDVKKDHSVLVKDIRALNDAGFIDAKKEGKYLYCCIGNQKILKLIKLAEEIDIKWKKKKRKKDS